MLNDQPKISNFIRQKIEADLRSGYKTSVVTRFPPEPNGYLHIGHAKSIQINFGLAKEYSLYGGRCHLRFDDTNPSTEDQEYEQAIIDVVHWLGWDWGENLFYASSYFEKFYECALALINKGLAYVDSQSADAIRQTRGSLTEPGKNSPYRDRSIKNNIELFTKMKAGEFRDGEMVVRVKIDMNSPNINMRDPTIYRIRHQHHYRSRDQWCIYPTYDFAHSLSDAIEGITHSICTLEFEDHRPLYEWVLDNLQEFFPKPHPQQIEFARLKINHTITSKRNLKTLVNQNKVNGWNDPRLPTIDGLRRRGYTPNSITKFCERIGVAKADSIIDISVLEDCLREDLNLNAPRRIAIINPIMLILDNYPKNESESIELPNHPQRSEMGNRKLTFARKLWIEADDFQEFPTSKFYRLKVDGEVRLRYGYIIKCTRIEKDENGKIKCIYAQYDPETKSGDHNAKPKKVKGNIHWLSECDAKPATARFYDYLFKVAEPEKYENILEVFNNDSLTTHKILVEPSLYQSKPEDKFQFERIGYFCADRYDYQPGTGENAVFNLSVKLRSKLLK